MRISELLRIKGDAVVTIHPDAPVTELLDSLADHSVGALVVSAGAGRVDGIVSERDVVRRLRADGPAVLSAPVSRIMTAAVRTCGPEHTLDELMELMTEHRIRHLPVVEDGELHGIVSIGDVVKHRHDELQHERDHLTAYITG